MSTPTPTSPSPDEIPWFEFWDPIHPAVDHIMRTELQSSPHPHPSFDLLPSSYITIYTSFHNYMVRPIAPQNQNADGILNVLAASTTRGQQACDALDAFFASKASEVLLGASSDSSPPWSDFIAYFLSAFPKYASGARVVDRLLDWLNRYWIKHEVITVGRGWRCPPPYESDGSSYGKLSQSAYVAAELAKWGAGPGASAEERTRAEACAEAASAPERIVPLYSLSMRKFRTVVLEPLSAETPAKESAMRDEQERLGAAMRDMVKTMTADSEEKNRMASELESMMRTVGVQPGHSLRRVLHIANSPMEHPI